MSVPHCDRCSFFFFQAEDGIRDDLVTGVQTCALPICDYELRAYTRWILNFGKHFIFTKPIKIVELDEIARNEETLEDTAKAGPGNSSLRIWTDQEKFYPGEGITLNVQALNSYNFPVASNLSISVTDVKSSVRAKNERTIVNDFN